MNIKDHETIIGESNYGGGIIGHTATVVCKTKALYSVAVMATEMSTRLALIACEDDGEDSAGRQKLRLSTPEEVASRSCAIAAALWAQFEQREWLFDLPLPTKTEKQKKRDAEEA